MRPDRFLAATAIVAVLPLVLIAPAAPTDAPPEPAGNESPTVRAAKLQLELAQLSLKRIERMNQRVANTVPVTVASEYRQDVEVARARLENALGKAPDAEFKTWLRLAEAASRSADDQWKSAQAANRNRPDTFDGIDLERLRLRAEIARLRVERGQSLANQPLQARLEWQVEFLNDEVQRLKEAVLRYPPPTRFYPLWWYY